MEEHSSLNVENSIEEIISTVTSENFNLGDINELVFNFKENLFKKLKTKQNVFTTVFNSNCLKEALPNEKERESFIENIIFNESEIDEKIIKRLYVDITDSFLGKNENDSANLNKLYRSSIALGKRKDNIENALKGFMIDSSRSKIHEAQAVINFYIEAFNIKKKDIDRIWDNTQSNSNKERERLFLTEILKSINEHSILEEPFEIKKSGKINFKSKSSGLPDMFLYNHESNSFHIGFATLDKGNEQEAVSLYKHSTTSLMMIHILQNKMKEEFDDRIKNAILPQHAIQSIRIGINHHFNKFLSKSNIDGITESDPLDISWDPKITEAIIRNCNRYIKKFIEEYSDDLPSNEILSINNSEKNIETVINIENDFYNQIFSSIRKKGSDLSLFYMGVSNTPKNKIANSNDFSDEEIISLINSYSYLGSLSEGFNGINIRRSESEFLIDEFNFRFNTSTNNKYDIINIEKINSSKKEFFKFYLENLFNNYKENTLDVENINNDTLSNMIALDEYILKRINEDYDSTKKISKPFQASIDSFFKKFDVRSPNIDEINIILENKYSQVGQKALPAKYQALSLTMKEQQHEKEINDIKKKVRRGI